MSLLQLDLTGLKCPLPALKTRKALLKLTSLQVLEVLTTDPLAVIDIPALVHELGDTLVSQTSHATGYKFIIQRN